MSLGRWIFDDLMNCQRTARNHEAQDAFWCGISEPSKPLFFCDLAYQAKLCDLAGDDRVRTVGDINVMGEPVPNIEECSYFFPDVRCDQAERLCDGEARPSVLKCSAIEQIGSHLFGQAGHSKNEQIFEVSLDVPDAHDRHETNIGSADYPAENIQIGSVARLCSVVHRRVLQQSSSQFQRLA